MQSSAATVEEYLVELPDERRAALEAVRSVVLANLDDGYEEGMQYGMIGYYVPHCVYAPGYHCDPRQPLPFAGLASQKNHMSLYLMSAYGEGDHWAGFREAWAQTGKKLDMGKCCIRFRRLDDLALDVIGDAIRRTPADAYVRCYEAATQGRRRASPVRKRAEKPASDSSGSRATKKTPRLRRKA